MSRKQTTILVENLFFGDVLSVEVDVIVTIEEGCTACVNTRARCLPMIVCPTADKAHWGNNTTSKLRGLDVQLFDGSRSPSSVVTMETLLDILAHPEEYLVTPKQDQEAVRKSLECLSLHFQKAATCGIMPTRIVLSEAETLRMQSGKPSDLTDQSVGDARANKASAAGISDNQAIVRLNDTSCTTFALPATRELTTEEWLQLREMRDSELTRVCAMRAKMSLEHETTKRQKITASKVISVQVTKQEDAKLKQEDAKLKQEDAKQKQEDAKLKQAEERTKQEQMEHAHAVEMKRLYDLDAPSARAHEIEKLQLEQDHAIAIERLKLEAAQPRASEGGLPAAQPRPRARRESAQAKAAAVAARKDQRQKSQQEKLAQIALNKAAREQKRNEKLLEAAGAAEKKKQARLAKAAGRGGAAPPPPQAASSGGVAPPAPPPPEAVVPKLERPAGGGPRRKTTPRRIEPVEPSLQELEEGLVIDFHTMGINERARALRIGRALAIRAANGHLTPDLVRRTLGELRDFLPPNIDDLVLGIGRHAKNAPDSFRVYVHQALMLVLASVNPGPAA